MKSTISNDLLTIKQEYGSVIKSHIFMLQINIRGFNNDLFKPKYEDGFSFMRDKNGILIISDTSLIKLLPDNLINMSNRHKVMCGS